MLGEEPLLDCGGRGEVALKVPPQLRGVPSGGGGGALPSPNSFNCKGNFLPKLHPELV